jgi:hypothetical protein
MRILTAAILVVGLSMVCTAQSTTAPGNETASQFYLRYRAAVQSAASIDQILAFWSPDQVDMYRAAPAAERMGFEDIKKAYATHRDVKVAGEKAMGNSATLTLEGTAGDNKRVTGSAQVIRIDGVWKARGPENWAG